jgi:hypothetical protein
MNNVPLISLMVTEPLYTGLEEVITEIPLDARLSSSYRFGSQVTQFPVESGAKITDHVHLDPEEITLEGLVSDSPITEIPARMQLRGDNEETPSGSRTQSAYDALYTVRSKRLLLTVVTEYKVYEDMVLESFEVPRSRDQGGLQFTATLKQIVTVESMTGALPPDVVARLKRRSKKRKPKPGDVPVGIYSSREKAKAQTAPEQAAGKVSPTEAGAKTKSGAETAAAKHKKAA